MKSKKCKKCNQRYTEGERFCRSCGFSEEKEIGESIAINLREWQTTQLLEDMIKEGKLEKKWNELKHCWEYKSTDHERDMKMISQDLEMRLYFFQLLWNFRKEEKSKYYGKDDIRAFLLILKDMKKEFNCNIISDLFDGVEKKIIKQLPFTFKGPKEETIKFFDSLLDESGVEK